MASIERTAYRRFKRSPGPKELKSFFTPSLQEIQLAYKAASGSGPVLSFLVMLKCFQRLGYFPYPTEIPESIPLHIAACLNVQGEVVPSYPSKTLYRHKKAIREYLGVVPFGSGPRHLTVHAVYKAAQAMDNPADLINVAIEELIKERSELPAFSTLDRLARRIRSLVNGRIFNDVVNRLTDTERTRLNQLLAPNSQKSRSDFNYLKEVPKSAKLSHLQELQTKFAWLLSIGDVERLLKNVPNAKIKHFAAEARALDASEMQKITDPKRYTLLLCIIHRARIHARDHLIDMFLKRIGNIHNKAKADLEALRESHRSKMETLISVLTDVLQTTNDHQDDTVLGQTIREVLTKRGGAEMLLNDCEAISSYSGNNYLPLLWRHYKSHRPTLYRLVRMLEIKSTTQDQSLIEALEFLLVHESRRTEYLPATLKLSFTNAQWERLVVTKKDGETLLTRRHLEICVFSYLATELKTGDLYITGSEHYADYREQLLPWQECELLIEDYCKELGFEVTANGFVQQLKDLLASTADEVDCNYPDNEQVTISEDGEPILKRHVRKDGPEGVTALEKAIYEHLPERSIIEILCNVEHWIGWTRHFGPLSGSDPKLEHAAERYIVMTFGYGCNLGPAQTSKHVSGAMTAHMLSFVNRRHVTAAKLDQAIRDIINSYHYFELPKLWGDSRVAAADGTKLDLYEENLLSEYHIRYGGYGGIAYHHVSDTYIALFSHFIPCGVWEAVYIIDGLIKNQSDIQPDTIHADTQGQSTPVFALSYLLGIKLMPRIRNWKDLKFYRADKDTSYKHIDSLFSDVIDWELIENHWKDLFQVVLSIKAGKVLPSTLLRKLSNYSRKNRLYQAFRELGRVVRTVFLLKYISDLNLREQITASTNKAEAYNGFTKWFFFGGEGVIAENDPEEQEKRIRYTDLVANAAILQNVVDMSAVIRILAKEGYKFTKAELAALSPYLTRHIRRFGEYQIDLSKIPAPLEREFFIPYSE